jgi:hypothetical protein
MEKSYKDVPAKRWIQNDITSRLVRVENPRFVGLADFTGLESYVTMAVKNLNIDKEHSCFVNLGDYDFRYLVRSTESIPQYPYKYKVRDIKREVSDNVYDIVDCDYCKSYLTVGEDLITIKNYMDHRNPGRLKTLMFTMCLRRAKREDTLSFLNEYLYKGTFKKEWTQYLDRNPYYNGNSPILNERGYIIRIRHTQDVFIQSFLYQYRDTQNMITGAVTWKDVI